MEVDQQGHFEINNFVNNVHTIKLFKPLVSISCGEFNVTALLDSGAAISCVAEKTFKSLGLKSEKGLPYLLKTVSGQPLSTKGQTHIRFKIGNAHVDHTFVVIEKLTYDVILGQDFLSDNRAILDFERGELILQEDRISFRSQSVEGGLQSIVSATGLSSNKEEEVGDLKETGCDTSWDMAKEENLYRTPTKQDYNYFSSQTNVKDWIIGEIGDREHRINGDLEKSKSNELKKMLGRYDDCFAWNNEQLGRCDIIQVDIETSDEQPIRCHPYRVSPAQREIIDKQVEEMLRLGVIKESNSSYASPVVLVKKPDGSWRFCIDYRKLNKKIVTDNYPIPVIDDIVSYLSGARYFAELDLNSGYWQTKIHKGQHKTAFITPSGLYEFSVVPFGLKTSQAVFQRMMDKVLGDLRFRNAIVYVDNIVVYGKTFNEFMRALEQIFERFREANLTFKPSKCKFGFEEIAVLGYRISGKGLSPNDEKLKAMQDIECPKNSKDVKRAMGLFSYYRKFINNFAQTSLPLVKLLKKGVKFAWSEEHQTAFNRIKEEMCKAPILRYFSADPNIVTRLHVDASNEAIGAALMQENEGFMHPVAYASRKLSDAERKYSTTEKECLALVWALRYFKNYLWGSKFQVATDHRPLCWLQSRKDMSGRLARWALAVQEWDFDIVYCQGRMNVVADFLSRNPLRDLEKGKVENEDIIEDGLEVFKIEVVQFQEEQRNDRFCRDMTASVLAHSSHSYKGFVLQNGLLYKNVMRNSVACKVVVLPQSLFKEVMEELHDDAWSGGHLGLAKTIGRFRDRYFMQNAEREIERYIGSCIPCQERRKVGQAVALSPVSVSNMLEKIGIDVLGPFRTSERGNRYIIVAMEYVSKFAITKAVPRVTAEVITDFLIQDIFCRFGSVKEIISDRGTVFTARRVQEIIRWFGAKAIHTSAFHPQTNGLVERFNRTLLAMLSKYVSSNQRDWCLYLPLVVYAYNTSKQASTRITPYLLMYGRDPATGLDMELGVNTCNVNIPLSVKVTRLQALTRQAVENIQKAQRRQKRNYDKKTRNRQFQTGELVLLYCPRRVSGRSMKLCRLYKGPYLIVRRLSNCNYVVKKVGRSTRRDVVHVNRLKHFQVRRS